MYTWKGRVVYDRKVHLFKWKDISRILRKMRQFTSLKEFTVKSIESFQQSMDVIEEDYIEAFRFSLWAFWKWVQDPEWFGTYSEYQRSLGTDLQQAKDELVGIQLGIDSSWELKDYGAAMVAVMLNIIEEIEEDVDASN